MGEQMTWTYDENSDAWMMGEPRCGCGVFYDENAWQANVVVNDIYFIGPFTTKEIAMKEAENEFDRQLRILGYK
jgi:hypothetical protein